jgi:hypothetical protein
VQIQKGGEDGSSEAAYPYTIVVSAIGNEQGAKAVEIVHRGANPDGAQASETKAYRWIEPGHTVSQLTHGSNFNAFELRNHANEPAVMITLHDYKEEL